MFESRSSGPEPLRSSAAGNGPGPSGTSSEPARSAPSSAENSISMLPSLGRDRSKRWVAAADAVAPCARTVVGTPTERPQMSTVAATPDLAAIKQKQQVTWSSGDFHVLAEKIVFVSEHLVDTADIHAGWRVLDVATGSGNAALAAARLGADRGRHRLRPVADRARPRARGDRGSRDRLPRGRRRGDPLPRRLLRRRHDRVRLDVRAGPPEGGRRARPRRRSRAARSRSPPGRRTGFIGDLFRTTAKHVPPPAGSSRRSSGAPRST